VLDIDGHKLTDDQVRRMEYQRRIDLQFEELVERYSIGRDMTSRKIIERVRGWWRFFKMIRRQT